MGTFDDILPATGERVAAHTPRHVNRRLAQEAEARLAYFARHPDQIGRRIEELDREWDIERLLEANAASVSLMGAALAATADRRWLLLPAGVAAFLLQHALQGWCPPVMLFRRLGVRTAREIEEERHALKYLRGDYATPLASRPPGERARAALDATRG
jgi:sirohydrochlorin ferrochelatase